MGKIVYEMVFSWYFAGMSENQETPGEASGSPFSKAGLVGCVSFAAGLGALAFFGPTTVPLLVLGILPVVNAFYHPERGILKGNQSRLEHLGWWLFVLGIVLLFVNPVISVIPLLAGYFITGGRVMKTLGGRLINNWTDINHDRWVDCFSYFFIFSGVGVTILGIVTGPLQYIRNVSSEGSLVHAPWMRMGALVSGVLLFSLGMGIRRRSLWAGILDCA